jgi:RNA polymerase sigma-70 factor (ECF subfamily)
MVLETEPGVPGEPVMVGRARDGDAVAFKALAEARVGRGYRLAKAILGSDADAAEAVGNALVAAWRELPRLREVDRFHTWFTRILIDECRMAMLRRSVPTSAVPHPAAADVVRPGLPGAADDDALAALQTAFDRLSPDDRVLLPLHRLEGLPLAELAELLRLPTGSIRWRLDEAHSQLLAALEAVQ